jgi:predicted restriction endonuclease
MDFVAWMKSKGLSEQSATNYTGALKGRLNNWAFDHQLTTKQILAISDPLEFAALAKMIKQTDEYRSSNIRGHGMYRAALSNYQKYLEASISDHELDPAEYGPCHRQVQQMQSAADKPFDPKGQEDARARLLREVVQRQGQRKFRQSLIAAYGGRCAITGCPVTALLEAAHITPYLGPDTNSITNGLLLRADLHTLWDLGLLAVEPGKRTVWVSPKVNDSTYQALSGRLLAKPAHPSQQPVFSALQHQWDLAHKDASLVGLEA